MIAREKEKKEFESRSWETKETSVYLCGLISSNKNSSEVQMTKCKLLKKNKPDLEIHVYFLCL